MSFFSHRTNLLARLHIAGCLIVGLSVLAGNQQLGKSRPKGFIAYLLDATFAKVARIPTVPLYLDSQWRDAHWRSGGRVESL
jgi:hypothetical protein